MKAARFYGIHDIRPEEIPSPSCGPEDVLIRVAYSGICGSDLHIYNKGMFIQNIPETMGHEFSGTVVETGSLVMDFRPGDRVVANPMVPCGSCWSCLHESFNTCESLGFIGEVRQGCFAEYIALPHHTLVSIPAGVTLRHAALAEPLAVVMNTIEKTDPKQDDRIAIIGAGPIGLLTAAALRNISGVCDITIINRSTGRLKIAREMGIPNTQQALPDGVLYDKIIDTAGRPQSFHTAVEHTIPGGGIYVVSIFEDDFSSEINQIVAKQMTVTGCNAYEQRHIEEALKAIAAGRLPMEPLISKEFDLSQCAEAFALLSSKDKTVAKLLFRVFGEEDSNGILVF